MLNLSYKSNEITGLLNKIYKKLYKAFGPQGWWPGEDSFEMIVGAILTQNTSWVNVEKAIVRLKEENLLEPAKIHSTSAEELALHIQPSGYYNIKAKRIKAFIDHLYLNYHGDLDLLLNVEINVLRNELLSICGIGPETADSILLYAGRHPIFVVDAYTKRIFTRHHLISDDATYDEIQALFMSNLVLEEQLFNEYHALIVTLGKNLCRPKQPKCMECPLM